MEMDGTEINRYTRFPPSGQYSPTHYHKGTAMAYVPQMADLDSCMDEPNVRDWQCSYQGVSDIY